MVGQRLGEEDPEGARFVGITIVVFGVCTLCLVGVTIFVGATPLARVFSSDALTIEYAVGFTRAFAVAMPFFGVFFSFAGGLRGAGDTRTPFYAQFIGQFAFMVGFSYLTGVVMGYDLLGVFASIALTYVW